MCNNNIYRLFFSASFQVLFKGPALKKTGVDDSYTRVSAQAENLMIGILGKKRGARRGPANRAVIGLN